MKLRNVFLMGSAAACLAVAPALAQVTPVTDEMLHNPPEGEWITYGRASDNYRHSPLTQITPENVNQLQLVWARGLEAGPMQGEPLVYEGVMYMPNPGDVIQAIDVRTGDLIWEHRRAVGDTMELSTLGDRKRGIVIYEDKLYFMSWDNHLVALDMETGQVAWEIDRGQGTDMVSNTTGPVVANGVIVAGSTCQYSPFGCFITGHDAATGEELWRNTFIPRPGEEGDDTWGDSSFEERWMTGVWGQIVYDPELDLVFYGTSATGPASEVQRNTIGGTQFGTNTRFAVRPETGEIVWRHQTLPRDNWDQECTFDMLVTNTDVNPSSDMDGLRNIGPGASGENRRVLTGVPCKTGTMWQFDAETGEFLWARDTVYTDMIDNIDEDGIVTVNEDKILSVIGEPMLHCPAYLGGRDWQPASYNPASNVYFIPLSNACQISTPRDNEPTAMDVYNVDSQYVLPEGVENAGRIDAINVETGETVWSYEQRAAMYAPIMTTASGLLFASGGGDRTFKALDQSSGDVIWQTRLAAGVQGHPITYEVDGRQYVAVAAGGEGFGANLLGMLDESFDTVSQGSSLYVFALPE